MMKNTFIAMSSRTPWIIIDRHDIRAFLNTLAA
jgi:hypothetical protein